MSRLVEVDMNSPLAPSSMMKGKRGLASFEKRMASVNTHYSYWLRTHSRIDARWSLIRFWPQDVDGFDLPSQPSPRMMGGEVVPLFVPPAIRAERNATVLTDFLHETMLQVGENFGWDLDSLHQVRSSCRESNDLLSVRGASKRKRDVSYAARFFNDIEGDAWVQVTKERPGQPDLQSQVFPALNLPDQPKRVLGSLQVHGEEVSIVPWSANWAPADTGWAWKRQACHFG